MHQLGQPGIYGQPGRAQHLRHRGLPQRRQLERLRAGQPSQLPQQGPPRLADAIPAGASTSNRDPGRAAATSRSRNSTLARLLAARPGIAADADAVARIAGGSAEISHLVSSLLRDLDEHCRGLLGAASVLGTDFTVALAAAVHGTGQEVTGALSTAEARGLITGLAGHPGSWRFTHALIRDGIYADLGEEQRIDLHARAAAALEPLAREMPERGGEVAAHLLRAAPGQAALRRAADWAAAAATATTSALAFEDAARYQATALAAADAAGASGPERAELLIALATAEYRAGQLTASLRHVVSAADAAEPAGRLTSSPRRPSWSAASGTRRSRRP